MVGFVGILERQQRGQQDDFQPFAIIDIESAVKSYLRFYDHCITAQGTNRLRL